MRSFTKSNRGDCSPLEYGLRHLFLRDYRETTNWSHVPCEKVNLELSDLYSQSQNPKIQQGEICGYVIEDAVLWPAIAGVRTRSGHLVEGSFHRPDTMELARKLKALGRFPLKKGGGVWASLGHIHRNFYHRFADSIPKIYFLHHPRVLRMGRVNLCYDGRFTRDELALVRALIPANVRLVPSRYLQRFSVEQYLHLPFLSGRRTDVSPTWATESLGYAPTEYHRWFRREFGRLFPFNGSSPYPERIYISRRQASLRKFRNEDILIKRLVDSGFVIVELEDKSLQEQACMFNRAKTVVAQHGAGLTNLIHMQSGARVVEIMSSAHMWRHYKILADSLGINHSYYCLDGRAKNDSLILTRADVDAILEQAISS